MSNTFKGLISFGIGFLSYNFWAKERLVIATSEIKSEEPLSEEDRAEKDFLEQKKIMKSRLKNGLFLRSVAISSALSIIAVSFLTVVYFNSELLGFSFMTGVKELDEGYRYFFEKISGPFILGSVVILAKSLYLIKPIDGQTGMLVIGERLRNIDNKENFNKYSMVRQYVSLLDRKPTKHDVESIMKWAESVEKSKQNDQLVSAKNKEEQDAKKFLNEIDI